MSNLRTYEVTMLIQPELDDEGRKQLIDKYTQSLTHGEGEDAAPAIDHWGRRQLAYPIKRNNEAYYVYFEADLDPSRVRSIEQALNYEDNILRYLFVRKES